MSNQSNQADAAHAIAYKKLKVTSTAFTEGGSIPARYTCDGENLNPPIDISGLPDHTKSLVIIVDDPDAPLRPWVHWLAWKVPVLRHIKEARITEAEGSNDFGEHKYSGPCPPEGNPHHYHFRIYALDIIPDLPFTTTRLQLERAINEHIIGIGELTGTYKRK